MARTKQPKLVTRESLQAMLNNADVEKRRRIIGRALVALFQRQTQSEKADNDAKIHNNRGFTGNDSKSGCITAKYFIKHDTLTDWQVDAWMKRSQTTGFARICKYAKQLNEIALEKARSPQSR